MLSTLHKASLSWESFTDMPRSLASRTSIIAAVVAALALLVLAVPALLKVGRDSSSWAVGGRTLQVKVAWKTNSAGLTYFAFAPGGRYFYTVTRPNKLSVFTAAGKPCYTVSIPGCDRLALAPDAAYALAYKYQNPADSTIVFLDSRGRVSWKTSVTGAVWSAAACAIPGGARFVLGTGKRCAYVYDVTKTSRRYRWWRAPGVVASINIDPSGNNITYGTWQESSIARVSIDGQKVWDTNMDPASLQYLQTLDTPDRMLLRSVPNRRGAQGEFCVLDADGGVVWRGELSAAAGARMICSPNGRYVCLGALEMMEHKGKSVTEKHAVLYDESGRKLWDQGSMFFHVEGLLVTSDGEAVLVDAKGGLFIVRGKGDLETSVKLPGSVVRSVQARDGSALLVECSDGSLCKLDIQK